MGIGNDIFLPPTVGQMSGTQQLLPVLLAAEMIPRSSQLVPSPTIELFAANLFLESGEFASGKEDIEETVDGTRGKKGLRFCLLPKTFPQVTPKQRYSDDDFHGLPPFLQGVHYCSVY